MPLAFDKPHPLHGDGDGGDRFVVTPKQLFYASTSFSSPALRKRPRGQGLYFVALSPRYSVAYAAQPCAQCHECPPLGGVVNQLGLCRFALL